MVYPQIHYSETLLQLRDIVRICKFKKMCETVKNKNTHTVNIKAEGADENIWLRTR